MTPRNLSLRIVAVAAFLLALNGCVNLDDAAGLSKLSDEARISLPESPTTSPEPALARTLSSKTRRGRASPKRASPGLQAVSGDSRSTSPKTRTFSPTTSMRSANSPPTAHELRRSHRRKCSCHRSKFRLIGKHHCRRQRRAEHLEVSRRCRHQRAIAKSSSASSFSRTIQPSSPSPSPSRKSSPSTTPCCSPMKRLSLDNFYKGPMASAQPNERLALILVQRQYAQDKTALQSRKDDIAAYGKIMDDIAALHTKLKQEADKKASIVEIAKQVGPIVLIAQGGTLRHSIEVELAMKTKTPAARRQLLFRRPPQLSLTIRCRCWLSLFTTSRWRSARFA